MTIDTVTPEKRNEPKDEGAALILVLVFMVVSALLILPVMDYVIAVTSANSVLSEKTKRMEAVRGALRISLSEPGRLYETCGEAGETVSRSLPSVVLSGVEVSSRCYFIGFAAAQDEGERRLGLAVTQVGASIPIELTGSRYQPSAPNDPTAWLADADPQSVTDQIWLPNLPVHGLAQRSSIPYQMPPGFTPCRVYFPGTYNDPLVVDGPTYFTSGVYYFESEVRVANGAEVVVGQGNSGCSTDQEAAFYAVNPPTTHNINGQGATWVFGRAGRLVVDNTGSGPISLTFSQRYVMPDDMGSVPSQGVSIMTVNGDVIDGAGMPLDIPGVMHVPLSLVGAQDPRPAIDQAYLPSELTAKPRPPSAPMTVTAQVLNGHLRVRWTEPDLLGGSAITQYTVRATRVSSPTEVETCITPPTQLECTLGRLTNGDQYRIEVVATNGVGDSSPGSTPTTVAPSGGSQIVTSPDAPTAVLTESFDGAIRVSWTPPASDGRAPITTYTVTGQPSGSCTAPYGVTSCVVTGLSPLTPPAGYTFRVRATNMAGTSSDSAASASAQPTGPALPPPPVPVPVPPYEPPPVVDLAVAGAAPVTIEIPGYVSVPQGRVRVDNPLGHTILIRGGLLAGSLSVLDGRAGNPPQPQQVPIGFLETIVQRTFLIVSETVSGRPEFASTAVLQVNQNGAYAVNSWELG